MAKKKQPEAAPAEGQAGNGAVVEPLSNKMEAVRRALDILGRKAKPLAIQKLIKERYGVEMTTKVISSYKNMLRKKRWKKVRAARQPKEAANASVAHHDVSFKDLRVLKELSERLGPAGLRELVEMMK